MRGNQRKRGLKARQPETGGTGTGERGGGDFIVGFTRKQMILIVLIVVGTLVAILNQTLMTPIVPTIMKEMSVDATTVT